MNEKKEFTDAGKILADLEKALRRHHPGLGAQLFENAPMLSLRSRGCSINLIDDYMDAKGVMILLDLLESLGYGHHTFTGTPGCRVLFVKRWNTQKEAYDEVRTEGNTRSEAVARAVLAVLSQQEAKG